MTTINNLTIEQMREIVEGAPEGATHYSKGYYYIKTVGDLKMWDERWFNIEPHKSRRLKCLSKLRTAIAEHDREFKVGDLVVLVGGKDLSDNRIFTVNFTGWYSQISVLSGVKFKDIRGYDYPKNWFRHATLSEIKAGHRLEAERHG